MGSQRCTQIYRHQPFYIHIYIYIYISFVNINGIPKMYAVFLTLLGLHKGLMITLQGRNVANSTISSK